MKRMVLNFMLVGSVLAGVGSAYGAQSTLSQLRKAIDEADHQTVRQMKNDGLLVGPVLEYGQDMFNKTYQVREVAGCNPRCYEIFDLVANPPRRITPSCATGNAAAALVEQQIYAGLKNIMIDLGLWNYRT